MRYKYRTRGTCSSEIQFDIEDGNVKNVEFYGGCNGNLKAISKLIDGMPAKKVIDTFTGNTCGMKSTSCADQLARALSEAMSAAGE